MDDEARSPLGVAGPSHFGTNPRSRHKPPEFTGRSVAKDRMRAKREHGCHRAALNRDRPMPVGINAPMQRMQNAAGDPSLDDVSRPAELEKLPPPNHPVLSPGQRSHRAIELNPPRVVSLWVRRTLWAHSAPYVRRVFHADHGAPGKRVCGAWFVTFQSRRARKRGSSPPVPPLALIPS